MSLAALSAAAGTAPVIERHRWAMTLAMKHGWGRPAWMDLAMSGRVSDRLVRAIATMVGQEANALHRAELAWLLSYCIERGFAAVHDGVTPVGRVRGGPLAGWSTMQKMGPYREPPRWWPFPASQRCPYCSRDIARDAVTCGEHPLPHAG